MVTDVNQVYCDNFAIYTNTKSLYCTPITTIILYVNYTSVRKNKNVQLFWKKIILKIIAYKNKILCLNKKKTCLSFKGDTNFTIVTVKECLLGNVTNAYNATEISLFHRELCFGWHIWIW